MKKYVLFIPFLALSLSSCEDEDIRAKDINLLQGTWKIAKTEITSGVDENIIISTDIPTGCFAQSAYEFRTDLYAAYTGVSGFGNNCNSVKTEGNFMYDEENKIMNIALKGDKARQYKILVLSSTELKLMSLTDNIDQNGDLEIDIPVLSFKK